MLNAIMYWYLTFQVGLMIGLLVSAPGLLAHYYRNPKALKIWWYGVLGLVAWPLWFAALGAACEEDNRQEPH